MMTDFELRRAWSPRCPRCGAAPIECGPSCICPEAVAIFAIGPKLAQPSWPRLIGEALEQTPNIAAVCAVDPQAETREARRQADLARKASARPRTRTRPSLFGRTITLRGQAQSAA